MTAIPLLSGVAGTGQAEFATVYPLNLEPLAIDNKIARGQLRATSGAIPLGTGPGVDRGGVTWNAQHYRVMGTKLIKVAADGTNDVVGDLGGDGPVRLDYSFDRLGIRSGSTLWYYDGMNLTQVIDEDLGAVVDMMWIDGYWMTTDGNSIIVTELSDPFSVLPLKYGSAEEDPDPVTGLMKIRDEVYVLNRHTIPAFRNVGGNGFPFAAQEGATIPYGCVSATAKCYFAGSFAFVGGARDQALGVRVAGQGDADKISTRAVDDAIAAVADPTSIVLESRVYRDEERLFVHLPEESWVFLAKASLLLQSAIWYRCRSGTGDPYRIRAAIPAYGKFICGDTQTAAIGELSDDVSTHFGAMTEWQFDVGMIAGDGRLQKVELVGLPGRGPSGEDATTFLSMTRDGQTFSIERAISAGRAGERTKRMQWRPRGFRFSPYLGLRFRGYNMAMPGFTKCEVELG